MTTPASLATEAIQIATDNGTREWLPDMEPEIIGSGDVVAIQQFKAETYRIVRDDTTFRLTVFDSHGCITDEGTFTERLARLCIPDFIARMLR